MCNHGDQFVVDIGGTCSLPGSVNELLHVDHPAKLNWFTDLASKQTETFQLDAQDSRRPFNQTLFFGRNFDVTFFTFVHAVSIFAIAPDAFLSKVMLQGIFDGRHLPDVEQQVHEVLEGS